jgi:hypothetical protein
MAVGKGRRGVPGVALLAAFVAAGTAAMPAPAAPSATLTVQVVPGAVSAGQPALAVAKFRNLSHATLQDVRVTLHFPAGLSVLSASGCGSVKSSAGNVVCSFGDVAGGAGVQASVSARLAAHLSQNRSIKVTFALRVGSGTTPPILTGASAKVLASTDGANRGSCLKVPQALTATFEQQITSLPSPPSADPGLKLPCTPLSVGVQPTPKGGAFKTRIASVDVPKLRKPAIVKLYFPNETLPDEAWIDNLPAGAKPSFDNPNPLWRIDEKTGALHVVPRCKAGGTLPAGWQACVLRVEVDPTDPARDWDSGTITLRVQGNGLGDPRFIG